MSTKKLRKLEQLEKFQEQCSRNTKKQSWSRLDVSSKRTKLKKYAEQYGKNKNLTKNQISNLKKFLVKSIQRKHFTKVKDVEYDKDTGEVLSLPSLVYDGDFSIKRQEDDNSCSLKNLGIKDKL